MIVMWTPGASTDVICAVSLVTGDFELLPANAATVASSLQAGQMRALAVFGTERDLAFPDVPTAPEQAHDVYGRPFVGLAVSGSAIAHVLLA